MARTMLPIPRLVAHLRAWLHEPRAIPPGFYHRHLDAAVAMSDEQLADVVRHVGTTRGAEMALVHHIRTNHTTQGL